LWYYLLLYCFEEEEEEGASLVRGDRKKYREISFKEKERFLKVLFSAVLLCWCSSVGVGGSNNIDTHTHKKVFFSG